MKKLVYALLITSIALNGYLLFQISKEDNISKANNLPTAEQHQQTSIIKEDEELKKKYQEALAKLEKQKEAMAAKDDALKALLQQKIASVEQKKGMSSVSIKFDELSDVEKSAIEKLGSTSKDVPERYINEDVDPGWAYQTQDKITKAIQEHGDLSAYQTTDLSCKSSVCRLLVKPYQQSQSSALGAGMNVSRLLNGDNGLDGLGVTFTPAEDHSQVEFFIWVKD